MKHKASCTECGKREHVFRGDFTLNDLCNWLFLEENYNSIVLCRNFQGYDTYPRNSAKHNLEWCLDYVFVSTIL